MLKFEDIDKDGFDKYIAENHPEANFLQSSAWGKVYDIDGDLVAEYSGKFDIETDHTTYILWDDEKGMRHIIYFSTFNIIIDEVDPLAKGE